LAVYALGGRYDECLGKGDGAVVEEYMHSVPIAIPNGSWAVYHRVALGFPLLQEF
jgi:hypothetical protein